MKLAITILSLALSAQTLANCAEEQPGRNQQGDDTISAAQPQPSKTVAVNRQRELDCMMRPAPFVQEPLIIELDDIEDEFVEESGPYPEARKAVASST